MPLAFAFTEYADPQSYTYLDLPKPTPGPGQLLVAVRASGVNPFDWKLAAGYLRAYVDLPVPVVFGTEVAGVVEQVGEGVQSFAAGDEVFGMLAMSGGYAEYALLSAAEAAVKPASLSFEVAATLPVAAGAAYEGIEQLKLAAGETLLLIGAGGGVGLAAAQIAVARGINVIGTASRSKKELVEAVGVTHVPYEDDPAAAIRVLAPDGVSAIYDMVGGQALVDLAGVLASPGRLLTAADPATAAGLGGGMVNRAQGSAAGAVFAELAALCEAGTLRPVVTDIYPLSRATDALRDVQSGHHAGKVVLRVR